MKTIATSALLLAAAMIELVQPAAAQTATLNPEQGLVTIVPCRVFRSAGTSTPAVASGTTRSVYVSGSGDFTTQGGPSGGCGVPASASAVAVSITTSHAGSTGTLAATVPGSPDTFHGTAISFIANQTVTTGLVIGVASNHFDVTPQGGSTNVTVDITGYYEPQIQAYIMSDGTIYSETSRIGSVYRSSAGNYQITVDRDVDDCAVAITPGDAFNYASGIAVGNEVDVYTWTLSGSTQVYTDEEFSFSVHC